MKRDSMRFWDRAAKKYAASPIKDPDGYEASIRRVTELLGADARVLEIGCGTGTTALKLAGSVGQIVATDISGEMIRIARDKAADAGVKNVTFTQASARESGSDAMPFDGILAFNVLHLVDDVTATLGELHTRLKPGGLLIAKTPCLGEMNPLIPWLLVPAMQTIGMAPYVNCLTGPQLEDAIAGAGFKIVAVERHASKGRDTRPFIVARSRTAQ